MIKYISLILTFCFLTITCKVQEGGSTGNSNHQYTNKLVNESSPYLLQHAHNPVDWYPWGDEALAKAKAEDKMMIISVGYAACHWCHVMEHESFEDTTVSRIMNENFICIKVDKEERPDIDDIYMTACSLVSRRSCGWPLNAFAMPDGRPVWAGTYFPKKDWMKVLEQFIDEKKNNPDQLKKYADDLTQGIQQQESIVKRDSDLNFTTNKVITIANNFLSNIDYKEGGRKNPPKFPMPNNYEFLLSYHHFATQNGQAKNKALDATKITLDKMAMGGIYDHLGGGFARYSTDNEWIVPHFEKMLYDNGQLVSLYSKAYQLTFDPLYKSVVEETLDYIKREMTDAEGGFYSSLDADSEGVEGKFYVWKKQEIDSLLQDKSLIDIFCDYYQIHKKGNWEHGNNVIYRKQSDDKIAKDYGISKVDLRSKLKQAKTILFNAREKRVRPGLDDKVLTSWNALMLKGYVDAYKALGKKEYLDVAIKNANFLSKNMMQSDNRLNRNYKDGKSVINAFLDDYALLADAFIALYQVTFDEQWLNKAKDLTEYAVEHFYDDQSEMFFYTSKLDPELIARKKVISDNVIPGSNSLIARDLYHLGLYFYKPEWVDMAKQMLHNISETIETNPQPNFYSNWCNLYLSIVYPPYEVAVIGENHEALMQQLNKNYIPNAIFLGGQNEGSLDLLKDKLQEGQTMIYVCQNKVCKFPVTKVEDALPLMR